MNVPDTHNMVSLWIHAAFTTTALCKLTSGQWPPTRQHRRLFTGESRRIKRFPSDRHLHLQRAGVGGSGTGRGALHARRGAQRHVPVHLGVPIREHPINGTVGVCTQGRWCAWVCRGLVEFEWGKYTIFCWGLTDRKCIHKYSIVKIIYIYKTLAVSLTVVYLRIFKHVI